MKNPFKHLLVPDFKESCPVNDFRKIEVFFDSAEVITINVAEPVRGKWALGYALYFRDGRSAYRLPSLEYGFFRSERDAVLYFTGQLLENESLFSEGACEAVKKLRDQQQQASIFS